jgi:hemoglobin
MLFQVNPLRNLTKPKSKGEERMKKDEMRRILGLIVAPVFLVLLCIGAAVSADEKPAAKSPSLYERVGGVNNIAVLVDDAIERSYVDETLHANPKIAAAHKRFPKPVYKFNATALACQVMGGPQKYTGRSLKEAHQHLDISEKEWNALVKIFRDSMKSFKVPQKEQDEIIAIIDSTKGDVVAASANQKK